MKYFIIALALIATITSPAHAEDKKLYLYTWDTYAAPDLFKKFEQETGIQVITEVYSSNDALIAKLKAGAAYDVVVPSGNYVPQMIEEKLLLPLPEESRAFSKGLSKIAQNLAYDPDNIYVLPLAYGTTSIAVNTKLVSEEITSWQQFFERPAGEKPSLGVSDDLGTAMDIASLAIGKPFCDNSPETFKTLQALMLKQKPFVKVYGWTGAAERMAANEIPLQMAWSGDVYKVRQQNPNVKYVYPKEGVEFTIDNIAIPASAKNFDAAKAFITFMMKTENAAEFTVAAGTLSTVKAAFDLLPEEMRKAPEFNIPEGVKAAPAQSCPPDVVRAYSKIWSQVTR